MPSVEARASTVHSSFKMTARALYLFVLGFSGLFAMQGCGSDDAAGDTTAAAEATTASP